MINIAVKGIEKVQEFLRALPLGVKTIAARGFAEYLIGDERHGLKHCPPYKHVPYSAIGGFESDRQRRYVMARIHEGTIEPGISASNGYFRDAWRVSGEAPRYNIVNDVGYAGFLVGESEQSLHSQKQGWRKISQTIANNMMGALRNAVAKVNEWLSGRMI